jgi:hypothetical protein
MGIVYAAFDPELDRKVALKLVKPYVSRRDPDRARARMLREAQAQAKLSHPNVVTVHDVGTHEDRIFVAMEFIEGVTLRAWLKDEKPALHEIVRTMQLAGQGLLAAHDKGLVHRDFKPDNVMVGNDGRVLVMDFGLATAAEDHEESQGGDTPPRPTAAAGTTGSPNLHQTSVGALRGTPAYMAPEQHLGLPTDARSDQFAYCVTYYEAIYGLRPFGGATIQALALNVTAGEFAELPRGRGAPRWLRRVLLKGLSRGPDDRYPSLRPLLRALDRDPRVVRRAWIGAATASVLIAGGIAGIQYDRFETVAGCAAEAASFTDAWGETEKGGVSSALLESDSDYARDTHVRVTTRLNAFAADWVKRYEDDCLATRIDDTLSEQQFSSRAACFGDAKDDFSAVVDALSEPSPGLLRGAVGLASSVPRLEQCDDDSWLERGQRQGQQRSALLQRANIAFLLGEYEDAEGMARQAAEDATSRNETHLHARASFLLARTLAEQGQEEDAAERYYDAVQYAAEAKDPALETRAWAGLVYVVSHYAHDPFATTPLLRAGEAAATRASWDPLARAALHNSAGLLAYKRQEWEEAVFQHEMSLSLREATLGSGHPDLGESLNNLGYDYARFETTEATIAVLEEAAQAFEDALGPHHQDVAFPLGNVAGAYREQGDLERAARAGQRALEIWERGDYKRGVFSAAASLGHTTASAGDRLAARKHFERSMEAAADQDIIRRRGAHWNMGTNEWLLGDHDAAVRHLKAALELAVDDPRSQEHIEAWVADHAIELGDRR